MASLEPRNDWHSVFYGLLRVTIELRSCSDKAFNPRRQNDPSLGRLSPYMARDFNCIGVIVAAAGDCANFRPAFESKADCCAA